MNQSEQNLTTLSKKQLKAIPILISARTITDGVKHAGISKTLFYEWMKDESFRNEFISRQNDIVETALRELKVLVSAAVSRLAELLESDNETIRFKAIALILEHTIKITEIEELTKRIDKIERRLQ